MALLKTLRQESIAIGWTPDPEEAISFDLLENFIHVFLEKALPL